MNCPGYGNLSGAGEALALRGAGALGFALGADDVFGSLTDAQKDWVRNALGTLNGLITQQTGTTCPTWIDPGVNVNAAAGCFQVWFNSRGAPAKKLRADGVFDEDTLCMLVSIAQADPRNFTAAFPPDGNHCPAATPLSAETKPGLSTGAMIGIGAAGLAAVGGLLYLFSRRR
jgi:hypothetical protein